MKLILDKLHPGEAAEVAGVSLDNQRNLRRAGYLPKTRGHARFSLEETARLLIFGALSERKIGPQVAATFADAAGRAIALSALWRSPLYSEDAVKAAFEESKVAGDHAVEIARMLAFRDDRELSDAEAFRHRGAEAKRLMVETLEAQLGAAGEKTPNQLFLFANGEPEFIYGEDDPFERCSFDHPAWHGPIIVFSIGAMAYLLASRLPRPIVLLDSEGEAA